MPKILNLNDEEKQERLRKQKLDWYYRNRSYNKNWKKKYRKVIGELNDLHFKDRHGCSRNYVIKQLKKIKVRIKSLDKLSNVYEKMLDESSNGTSTTSTTFHF
jgi:aminoglycoside phosphotransferase